ncbi:hypothetical protein B0H17DRAFT_1191570 [Mycena rosella]|uniref:RNase H type-1 domain-containing protein n=1 Tax=Mycena rosella TaxID=1033263 RepID=A0AAD7MAC1_MYCRO|nr:hypothetical protein B0H17DRAFT_1191570 [Mycena rosella]
MIAHTAPKSPKFASILHLVECVPGINWLPSVPARGQRILKRRVPCIISAEESPHEDFDVTLGMELIVPVYAAPWAMPLLVTTIILPKEDALRALEVALSDERCRSSTWFTDGSLLDGKAGGAAVRVEDGVERERLCVPLGDGEVCEGEMEGLICATTKALGHGRSCVLCIADSQAALKGILSTRVRSGQFCSIIYDKLICEARITHPHLTIINLWTLAHIGTVGNKLADAATKHTTEQAVDPDKYVSLTTTRRKIHTQILGKWKKHWESTKAGGTLCYLDCSPPSLTPIPLFSSSSLPRKISSAVVQLRTNELPRMRCL